MNTLSSIIKLEEITNAENVTPGIIGFLATAFVGIATILLVIDMNRRIRRSRYQQELEEMITKAEDNK